MKYIFILLSISIVLSSCKAKLTDTYSEEYFIINQMLLIAKPQYKEINIVAEPDNKLISDFKNGGFKDDKNNFYKSKFDFKNDKIKKWNKNISLNN